jgi:hypothetical protein
MMADGRPVHVVSTSARIKAAPDRVYRIIADYRNGHPHILPKQFSNLCVDAGGYGAGTVIRFSMTVMGKKMEARAVVSEPQPGRVLVEKLDGVGSPVTTFTVDPGTTDLVSVVTISTELTPRSGLAGIIERFMTTRMLTGIYKDELTLLAAVATVAEKTEEV